MHSATLEQKLAIRAQGNVLVVAGAGAGKTRTLIERCLAWLLDDANQASVDEILMVTFTQAAATEMRQRLRARLEAAPMSYARRAEQLALLETAHISTLHSFCFRLISQHFYELGLDPQLRVLSGEETEVLARQTLDGILDEVYDSETPPALAIQQLIQSQGGDWDQPVREAIGRLHKYSRTLRDPAAWFAAQTARFQRDDPEEWRHWLLDALEDRRRAWLQVLQQQPQANENAAQCAAALNRLPPEQRRRLQERIEKFNQLPAGQQQTLRNMYDRLNQLPAERQQAVRKSLNQFSQQPPDRRQAMRQELKSMAPLGAEDREARIASPEFREKFNGKEQGIVRDMSDLVPPK